LDVADFLMKLFGEGAAVAAGFDLAPTAEALTTESTPVPHGEPDADPDPSDEWILRPDVTGRMGWEPPGLPERER
jgi:hypothetical protein